MLWWESFISLVLPFNSVLGCFLCPYKFLLQEKLWIIFLSLDFIFFCFLGSLSFLHIHLGEFISSGCFEMQAWKQPTALRAKDDLGRVGTYIGDPLLFCASCTGEKREKDSVLVQWHGSLGQQNISKNVSRAGIHSILVYFCYFSQVFPACILGISPFYTQVTASFGNLDFGVCSLTCWREWLSICRPPWGHGLYCLSVVV